MTIHARMHRRSRIPGKIDLKAIGGFLLNGNYYVYKRVITIENTSVAQLDSGYSVLLEITGADASQIHGVCQGDADDLRIGYDSTELDREIWDFGAAKIQIWFKTQVNIPGSGSDSDYDLYYRNVGVENPPDERANIFSAAAQADGQFIPALSGDNLIVIDTEHYFEVVTVGGKYFQPDNQGGEDLMRCLSDTGSAWTGACSGPNIHFKIRSKTGSVFYAWYRTWCQYADDNSQFPKVNAACGGYFNQATGFRWYRASVTGSGTGQHSVKSHAREDGVGLDQVVITENVAYTPSGKQTPESYWRPLQDVEPTISIGAL